jgi:hypothetical protein
MGVLSALADEKKCEGLSRLDKIANLTQMFLFGAESASEVVGDAKEPDDQPADDEFHCIGQAETAGNASDASRREAAAAAAAAIPSYARPLTRGRTPRAEFQHRPLEAPELPYLAPKILRSPAKNVHISDRRDKSLQWAMSSGSYDAEAALISVMTKSRRAESGNNLSRICMATAPSHSPRLPLRYNTSAVVKLHTPSQSPRSRDMLATPPRKQAHMRQHKQMGEQEQTSPVGHLVIVDDGCCCCCCCYMQPVFLCRVLSRIKCSKKTCRRRSLWWMQH